VPAWLRADRGAILLEVLVQPRASRTKLLGEHDGRLKIALAAPPVDGEANAALVELLADLLGVKKAQVSLAAGESGRRKRIRVEGVGEAEALRLLV
jgi:uncharacterized protein (TIGR00251 family)